MNRQLAHAETHFKTRKFPVILLLDNITGDANIGSIFRMADAFGISEIIFTGSPPNLGSNRLKRTARNTFKTVEHRFSEDIISEIEHFRNTGFHIAALEITENSSPIHQISEAKNAKIVLIAGNERSGVSPEVLAACDVSYHIEMFGENSSMNVANSVGIGLYEIIKATAVLNEK